ncbi:MAG: NCS2 family permease [Lachnospiraceae bacterium]|nr:NCS2 family permease [Lachnospiraceae bacterium]
MEKFFKLKENGTNVKTEILAGLTTFMTMAYIVALNPNLLTGFDTGSKLWNAVFCATLISSGVGTICMALLANKPFAMSSGMGLNSFFAVVVAQIVSITGVTYIQGFQAGMIIILIEGIVFLILSAFKIREKIVEAIPISIRIAISPAIGMMLLNIGLGSNVGIYSENGGPFYVMRDFFGALTAGSVAEQLGSAWGVMVLTVITIFIGVIAMVVMDHKGVKGAVLAGMLIASAFYWICDFLFLHENPFAPLETASFVPPLQDMFETTLFKFDFATLFNLGWATVITLVLTFCMIDMFDTIGTLVGTASRANMIDEQGNMPNMKEALLSDAIGTIVGGCTGTSTITTFIESASGVEAGGRTGLTALVTGILFLLCLFLAPIAAIIPAAATSSALVYVGIIMISGLRKIDFDNKLGLVPVALMLIAMPVSGSIGHAIGIGMISYVAIRICVGKAKDVSVLSWVISALFLIKFFLVL